MRVVELKISGFRGVREATLKLDERCILIGASNAGKSTVIEALSLVLGRSRTHYRSLTEHDFFGSAPNATDRIQIIATIAGFPGNEPDNYREWFSERAGIEKWWDGSTVHPLPSARASQLCVQIAYCARFDLVDLEVETLRYFLDEESDIDPFELPGLRRVSRQLIQKIGFFFVPAQRTWDRTLSFNSELFRRVVRGLSELPAGALLAERDRLRSPQTPLESMDGLSQLIGNLNSDLHELIPGRPSLGLRVTETDSDSLLKALVPHFTAESGLSLPASRHGTGLVSLQTLLLLLQLGRVRMQSNESFILGLEEPEIHLPLGTQRRIINKVISNTSQFLVTTHSREIASILGPESVRVLSNIDGVATAPRLSEPLQANDTNAIRRLLRDYRPELLEALMYPIVLLPEGRIDYEWLSLILRTALLSDHDYPGEQWDARFVADVGVILTHEASIVETFERLQLAAPRIVPVVDGDTAGSNYVADLTGLDDPPARIIRWPEGWMIEDIIGWILKGAEEDALVHARSLEHLAEASLDGLSELVALLKSKDRSTAGLKGNYLAYDDLAAGMAELENCRIRCREVLDVLHLAASAPAPEESGQLEKSADLSSERTSVYVWVS